MELIHVLQCEDSLEGILTGIYEAFRRKYPPEHTVLTAGEEQNYRLFAEYDTILPDSRLSEKAADTLRRRLGEKVFADLCIALTAQDEQKAEAVYRTAARGLSAGNPEKIMDDLADPHVHHVFRLARGAWNEVHRWKQFLRFQELENHILLAVIGPEHDVLTWIAPHFADRLPLENFAIYDEHRDRMVLHPAGKDWYLVRDAGRPEWPGWSADEAGYQELFRYFCHKLGIRERKNEKLQQQMAPLRFQKYMFEFDKKEVKNREGL